MSPNNKTLLNAILRPKLLTVTKSLLMKVFVTTTSFFEVNAKSCGLQSRSKLFG